MFGGTSPGDVAWLCCLSITAVASPALTTEEQGRVRMLRDKATDARVRARAATVATLNSIT